MTVLREIAARFTTQADTGPIRKMDASIGGLVSKLQGLGGALIGGLAAFGIGHFVKGMIELGDELGDTSGQLGISAEALQRWRFIAQRSGVDAGVVQGAFARLARSAATAGEGAGGAAGAFRRLGVSTRGADGQLKSTEQLFRDLAVGMAGLPNQTEKMAIAQQIFGRSGAQLVPILSRGAAGIAELEARFRELGGGAGPEFVEMTDKADAALIDLDLVTRGVKSRLAVEFLPTITRVISKGVEWVSKFAEVAQKTGLFKTALQVLTGIVIAFGIAWGAANIPTLVALALIVLLTLAVNDLQAMFRGGQSVIGDFLDEMFGVGTATQFVRDCTDAWEGLIATVKDALHFLGLAEQGADAPDQGGLARGATRGGARQSARRGVGATERDIMISSGTAADILGAGGGLGALGIAAHARGRAISGQRRAPRSTSIPVQTGRGVNNTPVAQANTVNIDARGADAQQVAHHVRRELDRRHREAHEALVQEVED